MTNARVFVHVPAQLLGSRLNYLLNRGLQPEIACHEVSFDQLDFTRLGEAVDQLAEAGLGTTLHAPFSGFDPGSRRNRSRRQSRHLAEQSLLLAERIGAARVVFHPGLPFASSAAQKMRWLESSLEFWPEFIPRAQAIGCCICVENIYEDHPAPLVSLFRELDSPWFGTCFDIGHWNVFGRIDLPEWLEQVGPFLRHLHLHDNHGDMDQHLPIDSGNAPFGQLFTLLTAQHLSPSLTLEARDPADIDRSLTKLGNYLC